MNKPSHKKVEWKNLLVIFAVLVPSIITYLYHQSLFKFSFGLFSDEQILVLIPSDGGLALCMLGIFLFFGSLVSSIVNKKLKTKKVSVLALVIGIIITFIGLQNYTTFTNRSIVESRGYRLSKMHHEYSRIDKVEIEADIRIGGTRRNYGLNCGPYFKITALLNPYKKVLTAHIAHVDKELVYTLMNVLRDKNIPTQGIVLNNCIHHPDQFKTFKEEFDRELAE